MNPIIEINNLIDFHGGKYEKCEGCAYCERIKELGKLVFRKQEEKYAHILAKGQDMNVHDILFLLENEVELKSLKESLGLGRGAFDTLRRRWEFELSGKLLEPPAKDQREYQPKCSEQQYEALKVTGLSDREIASKLGMHKSTLARYKRMWKGVERRNVISC